MIDFYYINKGFYYSLIPRNDQAVKAYNQGAKLLDMSNIPLSAWNSVKWQLQQAGYKIRKAPKQKPLTAKKLDEMLKALDEIPLKPDV